MDKHTRRHYTIYRREDDHRREKIPDLWNKSTTTKTKANQLNDSMTITLSVVTFKPGLSRTQANHWLGQNKLSLKPQWTKIEWCQVYVHRGISAQMLVDTALLHQDMLFCIAKNWNRNNVNEWQM